MFRVTSMSEQAPGSSPAAVVRDGRQMVLVLSANILTPDLVHYLDTLLRTALTPVLATAPIVDNTLTYGVS